MAVTLPPVEGNTSSYKNQNIPTSEANSSMTLSDFYKLLATQLQYQDPDNPMDTSEMMGTMVQTQMIQAITQMSSINTTTYAASMMGKEVTVAEVDKNGKYTKDVVGVVSSVILGDNPIIFVKVPGKDGAEGEETAYSLSQIVAVGKIPDPPKEEDKTPPPEGGGDDK